MIVYNNKEYRNLVEQVQKNKADIEDWKSKQETLANWGIRIVGQIESESDLPEDYEGEYGDAYQVGTGDTAKYFAWIRPTTEVDKDHWMDMGSLSIAGPQGPAGDEITGISNAGVTYTDVPNRGVQTDNTIKVTMSDGRTIDFTVTALGKTGDQGPQGIQGIQGIQGPKGDKGDKGDVGPQGEMGPTVAAYHIVGIVSSTAQLPDPETLMDLSAAYIVEVSGDKALYVQIGKTMAEAKWVYLGDIAASDFWEISGSTIAPVEAVDLVQINNLNVLTSGGFSCTSPHISGVAACSAISSPMTLTLSGTTGVELLNNGKTITAPSKAGTIALTSDVESVSDKLTTETTERKAQDTALQTNIDKKANTTDLDTLKSSVNSNWDLLMANLGIGRWANQTFYNFSWETPVIYDDMLKDYTNYSRCFANLSYNENDSDSLSTKDITFDSTTYFAFGEKSYSVIAAANCFYNFKNASNLTIRIDKDKPYVSCNSFCQNANITSFNIVDLEGNQAYIIPTYIEYGFRNCVNLTSIKGIDFSNNPNQYYGELFANCPKLTNIQCKGLNTSFNIRTTGITTSEQLQTVIDSMTTVRSSDGQILINSVQNSAMTDTQRTYLTNTLGWTISVA